MTALKEKKYLNMMISRKKSVKDIPMVLIAKLKFHIMLNGHQMKLKHEG